MNSGTTVLALSAAVWFATPTFAGTSGLARTPDWENGNGAAIYVLAGASAQALERARMSKGSRRSWCLMKNVQLNEPIERLEVGGRVILREIQDAVDGVLGREFEDRPIAFGGCE